MDPLVQQDSGEEHLSSHLLQQIAAVGLHTFAALLAWALVMAGGYAVNQPQTPQVYILLASFFVPFLAGAIINHFSRNPLAPTVWLVGMIWFLIVALWILDMPTGPSECFQCDATSKLMRTFFSLPSPSGLIDNDGPFFATWPTAALLGYSMGAALAIKRKRTAEE